MAKKETKQTTAPAKEVASASSKKEQKKDAAKKTEKPVEKKTVAKKEDKKVEKKVEKKEDKKAEKNVEKKTEKKVEKKADKKVEKKDDKKVEKKAEKKSEKKEKKPTSEPTPADKKAPVAKKVEQKENKKPPSERVIVRELMRKDPKARKEIAKGVRGLSKQRAHAKMLKLRRKNRFIKFVVDCHKLYKDKILRPKSLQRYFKHHIKVDGKTHNFGRKIKTKIDSHRVVVLARPPFAKRYLKYLTRRYLKKNLMRDHVRIVSHGQNGYRLGYYKISMDEGSQ